MCPWLAKSIYMVEEDTEECREVSRESVVNVTDVHSKVRVAGREARKVRVATWNFSGICSQRKQKEVAGVLKKNNVDICAGQESWEKEESNIYVDGYKWFGNPRQGSSESRRGEGGVGFLVKECLASGVELIKDVSYEQSMWIKVKGENGRNTLFLGCVYMPTDSESVSVIESSYEELKEDVLRMKERGQVVLLGDFNARVGRSSELDDVIGMFGEGKCNASGNRMISFLTEVELVICNGREFSVEPQWTRARPALVGELFKYGGSGMANLLKALYEVVWTEEGIPKQWRQGLIVSLYKKGDVEDPGNYRGITLLNVVGKLFCKILNNRLVIRLESEKALHEGQAGFRAKRSCVDNVYTLNEIIQGRMREGKYTYAFFLDIQKAFDTVWHDGLWFRLWELGVRGRMWRVIKKMYDITESAVLLEGEKSKPFDISQGVAQGCSLSPILFSIFINQLLDEVEKAGLGIIIKNDVKVGGLMFADDFVGLTTNAEDLQKLINVVQGFCNKWRLKSNIKKSAVVVFSKVAITDMCAWKWGDNVIPRVVSYCYLGIEFAENGSWDSHVQKVIDNGKKKLNRLHRFVSNRNISTVARRLLLVSVLRPTLEYGSEVWACNKRQTASLESIQLGAAKKILGCSSKTCNEAVRGDMGLESLKGRRDRSKLKWWYKVNKLDIERYPRVLLDAEWEVKPCRGRQRKTWMKVINELLLQLDLDSQEVLAADNINLFLDTVDEALRDREYKDFNDSLNTKVKLNLYKSFCKEIEFKNYLQGVGDPGTRLLFKFRSGTNGLNEELGRHRGKNDDRQCKLCRGECESVVHVLWECPAYDSIRNNFMVELENLLGGRFGEFSTLDNFNKASFILGFENWNRDDFKALLKLVKSFVLLIWETRKKELYGDQDCVVSGCSCSCPLTGGLTSSACVCGCVVNGVSATAAT